MKYTIEGLSQRICIKLGLDNKDVCILRFIIDFYSSGKMKKIIHENKEFIWVHYETLIQEIPIINIKDKGSLSERLKKLVNAGILERYIKKDSEGSFSYYHLIPDMIYNLQSDNYKDTISKYEENEGGYRSKPGRGTGQNRDGVPVKTGDIYSSTNNPSTNNISNKITPDKSGEINQLNKCPEIKVKTNKGILTSVKKAFALAPFSNVLPDDDAAYCNTDTYVRIQEFMFNLHECKVRTGYEWNDEWVESSHIDFKALREKAIGTNGSSRLPFEVIDELLEKSIKRYMVMRKGGYWPEKKETLTLNFKDFLYNYRTKKSWFLFCLFNEPVKLSTNESGEKILSDLPKEIQQVIKNFHEGEYGQDSWGMSAYYEKARDLYLWYSKRLDKFKRYHELRKVSGFYSAMGCFGDLLEKIYDYMSTWRTKWSVGNFGRNCKTWDKFVDWLDKEFGFELDVEDEVLEEYEKRWFEQRKGQKVK